MAWRAVPHKQSAYQQTVKAGGRCEHSTRATASKSSRADDLALRASTGLLERERKLVAYYTLATHMLPHVNIFPLLVLRGKMGTGKSQALKIIV